jgi:hypothetical protein
MATPCNRVRTTDKAVKRVQSLTPQTIALCMPINGRRSGDAKMADCIRLTLAAGARFERRRLSRKRGNGRMMCLPIGRVLTVLAVACAVLVAGTTLGRADDFQVSYTAGSRDAAGRFAGGTEMRLLTPA